MKEYIMQAIAQETIDLFVAHNGIELVRCRDCAYGTLCCGNIKCVKPGMKEYEMDLHPVNWFCADGERRSDNDDNHLQRL